MQNLTPYLMFNGNCEEAMNFYKEALNGEIGYMGRFGDSPMEVPEAQKNRIMHVEFSFWGGKIMASDHADEAGFTTPANGANIHLSLGFDDTSKMEETFNKMAEGGKVTMPLQDTFWGDRFGMLQDKFGINWMFSAKTK